MIFIDFVYITFYIFRKKYKGFTESTAILSLLLLPIWTSLLWSLPLSCPSLCDQLTLTLLMTKMKSNFNIRSLKRSLLLCLMPTTLGNTAESKQVISQMAYKMSQTICLTLPKMKMWIKANYRIVFVARITSFNFLHHWVKYISSGQGLKWVLHKLGGLNCICFILIFIELYTFFAPIPDSPLLFNLPSKSPGSQFSQKILSFPNSKDGNFHLLRSVSFSKFSYRK